MKTAVVTGASRGIGLEFCRQLSNSDYEVIALCRKVSPTLKKLGLKVFEGWDVGDEAAVTKLKKKLPPLSIDLLINNAGILKRDEFESFRPEDLMEQFRVNAIGPLIITRAFVDMMKPSSKLVLITSRMGSIGDHPSGGYFGYRMSKTALNMAGACLSYDLKPRNISVGIFHPGYVKTEMTGQQGNITTEESVRGILKGVEKLNSTNSGTFWHETGEVLPW